MEIKPGMKVLVTDAFGAEHAMKTVSGIEEEGHSFPVVWVINGSDDRVPWPVESVRPA